jgi:hypothetical protein
MNEELLPEEQQKALERAVAEDYQAVLKLVESSEAVAELAKKAADSMEEGIIRMIEMAEPGLQALEEEKEE